MADTKISALTLATSVDGTEIAPIVQTGTNKRATLATVKAYVVADATLLKTTAIGTTVQAYSANTVSVEKAHHLLHDINPIDSLSIFYAAIAGVCVLAA